MVNRHAGVALRHIRLLIARQGNGQQSDRQLLERFLTGSEEDSFATLLRRHGPMVLRVCRGVLHDEHAAEDAFQATFLVLARKAASIRGRDSVGGWLRGVAYRVALKARSRAGKTPDAARLSGEALPADVLADMTLREVRAVLGEELQRLPAKYREPLCLCYLEGRTRDEAAQQLGWALGTFNSRLNRGRELLRGRLTRRGLSLSGALLATLLSGSSVAVAMPRTLADVTLRAALSFAAGKSVAAGLSEAVALAEGVLQAMMTTKVKLLTVLVMAFGLVGIGVGMLAHQAAVAQVATANTAAADPAPPANPPAAAPPLLDRYQDPLPENALARMGTLRGRHTEICYVACLPDGKSALTASRDGTIRLWDTESAKEIRRFQVPEQRNGALPELEENLRARGMMGLMAAQRMLPLVSEVALSADGQVLAAAPLNGTIHLWNVATGKELPAVKPEKGSTIVALAFSPDGQTLAVWQASGVIRVYEVATGREQGKVGKQKDKIKINGMEVDSSGRGSMAFAADGKTLLVCEAGVEDNKPTNSVRVWDVKTGREARKLNVPGDTFFNALVSPDARLLAWTDIANNAIVLWDADKDKELRRLDIGGRSTDLVFSPDGKWLAVKSARKPIQVWDIASGKQVAKLGEDREGPPGNGAEIFIIADFQQQVVAFSADGKTLVSGGNENTVRVWDVATGKERAAVGGHQGSLMSLAPSVDGKVLTTRGADDTVRHWDSTTGRQLRQFRLNAGATVGVFSPDAQTFAFGTTDETVRLWDVAADKELIKLDGAVVATDLAFSPDGKALATMSRGHVIRLWDTATGKEIRSMKKEDQGDGGAGIDVTLPLGRVGAQGLMFSPDGRVLASVENKGNVVFFIGGNQGVPGDDLSIRLWNVATGKLIRKLDGSTESATAIAYSHDSRMLAVAYRDQTISVWELATGKRRFQIKDKEALPATVTALAWSPDGKTLALGGGDRSIRFWDVLAGKALGRFSGHAGMVDALAFAPDGRTLFSGSEDTTALVWSLTGLKKEERRAVDRTDKELEALWADLQGDDAAKAGQAIDGLSTAKQTIGLLRGRLRPVASADDERLKELVAALNSTRFEERKKAAEQLEKQGELAAAALQKVLEDRPPLEVRKRVEEVLDNILTKQVLTAEQVQALRALEVLERTGTPEARQILETLGKGAPAARLTREAQAAFERLSRSSR